MADDELRNIAEKMLRAMSVKEAHDAILEAERELEDFDSSGRMGMLRRERQLGFHRVTSRPMSEINAIKREREMIVDKIVLCRATYDALRKPR